MCSSVTVERITCEDRWKVMVYADFIVELSVNIINKDEKDLTIFQKV